MKTFIYNAPTPCHFTADGKDYSLYPGDQYDLPETVEFVKTLVAQNKLAEVAQVAESQKPPKK